MRIDVDRRPAYVLAVSFALASAAASAAGLPLLSTGQDPDALAINIDEGETREWTDNIEVGHTNIYVNVASNGTLAISGNIAAGSLVKRGLGRVAIAGRVNRIEDGIFCEEGIMSVQDASSLEETGSIHISDGTFEFAGDGSGLQQTLPCPLVCSASMTSAGVYGIVDLKIEAPLAVTNVDMRTGCILKRGVGRLTFAPASGGTMTLSMCDGTRDGNGTAKPQKIGDISSDYWPHPKTGYSGFNVAEGEVAIIGDSSATVKIDHWTLIPTGASGLRTPASLVFDGVKGTLAGNGQFSLACYSDFVAGDCEASRYPRLMICNGADISTKHVKALEGGVYMWPTSIVDSATWRITGTFSPYGDKSPYRNVVFVFRNKAKGYFANQINEWSNGGENFIAVDSVLAKNESLEEIYEVNMAQSGTSGGKWLIGSNSVVAVSRINVKRDVAKNGDGPMYIDLDGGEWRMAQNTLRFTNANQVVISTLREAGATIPVADGATAFVGRAISGAGGIAKTGGGTIRFEPQGEWTMDNPPVFVSNLTDSVSLAFEGLFDVREGSAFVESGACRKGGAYRAGQGASIDFDWNDLGSGVAFSGAGSFSNFTATAATISVPLSDDMVATNGAPSFSSATLGGPVLVDFGQLRIPERGAKVVVATFLSGAPSLAKWSTSAVPKGFAASLRMDGSSVVADIRHVGFTIRLR